MLELIVLVSLSLIFIVILVSQVLEKFVPTDGMGDTLVPGVGFGNAVVTRPCSVYQTYSLDTRVVDNLTAYPYSDDICLDGTIWALEKISTTCQREGGCLTAFTKEYIDQGRATTYYQECGDLEFCSNLSFSLYTQGRCVSLRDRVLRDSVICDINDTYVYNGKFRLPTGTTCLAQNLSFIPCKDAPLWEINDRRIYSGDLYLTTELNRLAVTTDSERAARFSFFYAQRS